MHLTCGGSISVVVDQMWDLGGIDVLYVNRVFLVILACMGGKNDLSRSPQALAELWHVMR